MDWSKEAPLGWRFVPTDAELMWGFLYPEVERGGGSGEGPIKFSDQVYKKPPWKFCTDSTALRSDGKHYFFTELEEKEKKKKKKKKKKNENQNRVARTVGSYGTWHESTTKKIFWADNSIMGFRKLMNFKEKCGGKEMKTDWLMHEFSLPDKKTNKVLCVIQRKKKKEEEMDSTYDKYPEFDPKSCRVRDSITSARGNPCPAPAAAHDDRASDSEEEEIRPSKKMRADAKVDDDRFSCGDPCPAPAPAHDDRAFDSEKEEIRPKLDDHPFSFATTELDDPPADGMDSSGNFFEGLSDYLYNEFGLHDVGSGLRDGVSGLPDDGKDSFADFSDGLSGLLYDESGLHDDGSGLRDGVSGLPDDVSRFADDVSRHF